MRNMDYDVKSADIEYIFSSLDFTVNKLMFVN